MAKGLQKHTEKFHALNFLGKDLTRRASSKCELCESGGISLHIYEVSPIPSEPNTDNCLMICAVCKEQIEALEKKRKLVQADHWRCLGKTVWGTLPAAQVVSVRILRQLTEDYPWAGEILESLYLDTEVEEWIDA